MHGATRAPSRWFPRYSTGSVFSVLAPRIGLSEVVPLTRWVFGGPRFHNGSLTPDTIHHHRPDGPDGPPHASHAESVFDRRLICLSYPARLETCVPRARVRQFSLAPLPSSNGLSSPQLVTGGTVSGTPWVGLTTHTPIDRHIRAFAPGGRVRVAQPPQVPGQEWGRRTHCSVQRPVAAAPARLGACGYRSLIPLATESWGPPAPRSRCGGGGSPRHGSVAGDVTPVWAAHEDSRGVANHRQQIRR